MSIIFCDHYIYFLSFKLFLKIIKLINKFNTKSHLVWNLFSLIKKIGRIILYFPLLLKIVSKEYQSNGSINFLKTILFLSHMPK